MTSDRIEPPSISATESFNDSVGPPFISRPYFAPSCRTWKRTHPEVEHHERFGAVVGKECQCPCHGVHARWWSDA